jgi:hypothetical protein
MGTGTIHCRLMATNGTRYVQFIYAQTLSGSVRGVWSEGGSFRHTSIMKSPTGGWERQLHRSRSRAPRDLARFPELLTLDPPANPHVTQKILQLC